MPLTQKLASTLIATIPLLASRLADGITYTPLPLKPDDLPATRRPVKLYSVNELAFRVGEHQGELAFVEKLGSR